ncbi:glycine reductase [Ligilactobacillus agilis]|nr:glycine reductase [Ligilactobacillus agilis]UNL59134.1 glycine reductase [Ligilactobacillus agilis]
MLKIVDEYTHEQYEKIVALNSKWSDYDFDKIDGYIYFVDLEKELVPPELTPADRKRFIEYLKKEIEVVNK